MDGNEKIDFGPLDPRRDEPRWEAMVQAVARRGIEGRRSSAIARQLRGWARPTLAVAATLAVAVWVLAYLRPAQATTAVAPAAKITAWAWNDEVPATSEILDVLGGNDGAR